MLGRSLVSWYATVQSVGTTEDISRNTRKAKALGLIKTRFEIKRISPDEEPVLRVREWDASKDWGEDYRLIFEAPAKDMKARKVVADLFKVAASRANTSV